MYGLEGKVVFVTGAASGIGLAAVEAFAREQAMVIATDIDSAELERATFGFMQEGLKIKTFAQDVTDEALWAHLFTEVAGQYGGVDVLVNNAGIGIPGDAEHATVGDWRRVMTVNLEAVFIGQREAIRAMKERGGSIINVSSIAGKVGEPLLAAYNASKGGVGQLTKAAALHCAAAGYPIRVNSLHPGYTLTPLVTNGVIGLSETDGEAFTAAILAKIPMGRMAEPREIARPMLFLACADASYMTGAELIIDGGYLAA